TARVLRLPMPLVPQVHEDRVVLVRLALGSEVGLGEGRLLVCVLGNAFRLFEGGLRRLPGSVGLDSLRGMVALLLDCFERIGKFLVTVVLALLCLVESVLRSVPPLRKTLDLATVVLHELERSPLGRIEIVD